MAEKIKKSISLEPLVIAPHISEKASALEADGSYVFRVTGNATKILLKNAFEGRFGVKVDSVRILGGHAKKIRRGATIGHKPGFKKAIIKLQKGHTLPEF